MLDDFIIRELSLFQGLFSIVARKKLSLSDERGRLQWESVLSSRDAKTLGKCIHSYIVGFYPATEAPIIEKLLDKLIIVKTKQLVKGTKKLDVRYFFRQWCDLRTARLNVCSSCF